MSKQVLENKVIRDKDILGGLPIFKGTRMPIGQLFALLGRGLNEKEIIKSFSITKEQFQTALEYAAHTFNGKKPR